MKMVFIILYILGLIIAAYNFKLTNRFKNTIKEYTKVKDIAEEYFSDKYMPGTYFLIGYCILFFIYIIASIILKFTTGAIGFSLIKLLLMAVLARIVSKSLTTRYKAANKKCIQILEELTGETNIHFDLVSNFDEDNSCITYKINKRQEFLHEN